jgi:ArsR family transcriptional regulator
MRQAVKIFKALSDPTRLRILMLLLQRELCVCELVYTLKMEQSRISHQLRVLRDADLVEDVREGKWTNYRIPDETKKNLRVLFDKIPRENLSDSEEFEKDRKNLGICISENIRQKKCLCNNLE